MTNSKISIIVAVAGEKRIIGRKGGMPWYIPEELKRFKEITMGHPIIMGRKTHESIGKALPGRVNIIISRELNYLAEGCIVVSTIEEAVKEARNQPGSEEIFIIGGGQIYQQALPLTDKLYLTYIDKDVEGDVSFPDYSNFTKIVSESAWQESQGFKYRFLELER